jgi:predicted transcriptional regulator
MERKSLSKLMVAARKEVGMTQEQVAIKMGTTQEAVSSLERGAFNCKFSTIDRYANAIGRKLWIRFI